MKAILKLHIVLAIVLGAAAARAEGHGPTFGLATPTLARGQWSSDTVAMQMQTEAGGTLMFREMLGYGITEDLQAILTVPAGRSGERLMMPPRTRVGSMMGAFDDIEASLLWRFQRTAPAIGVRRESALLAGISRPDDANAMRGDTAVGTGLNIAVVTGYASRAVYAWAGAGMQRYTRKDGDELGALYYLSGVFGWRPPFFQHDYPKPDWRVFIEGLMEIAERNRVNGSSDADSGGRKLLLGPSVLGLYGRWGIEAGVLWPVRQSLNGNQPEERYRAKLIFTYWF